MSHCQLKKAAVAEIFNCFSRNLEMSLTLEELVMDENEFDKVRYLHQRCLHFVCCRCFCLYCYFSLTACVCVCVSVCVCLFNKWTQVGSDAMSNWLNKVKDKTPLRKLSLAGTKLDAAQAFHGYTLNAMQHIEYLNVSCNKLPAKVAQTVVAPGKTQRCARVCIDHCRSFCGCSGVQQRDAEPTLYA